MFSLCAPVLTSSTQSQKAPLSSRWAEALLAMTSLRRRGESEAAAPSSAAPPGGISASSAKPAASASAQTSASASAPRRDCALRLFSRFAGKGATSASEQCPFHSYHTRLPAKYKYLRENFTHSTPFAPQRF